MHRTPPPFTPEFRVARSFTADEVRRRLDTLASVPTSGPSSDEEAERDPSWGHYYSEATIACEGAGPPLPGGPFERARELVERYEFSDPRIVTGYFDPDDSLLGRPMLLEIRVLAVHYLCGVVVRATRDETNERESTFGYRYDTLQGHLEAGAEWFLLTKDHATGVVRFRIQAAWREGQFPNWWSELGFQFLCRPYQRAWHRLAYVRLRQMLGARDLPPLPRFGGLLKEGRPVAAPPLIAMARRGRRPDVPAETQT